MKQTEWMDGATIQEISEKVDQINGSEFMDVFATQMVLVSKHGDSPAKHDAIIHYHATQVTPKKEEKEQPKLNLPK